MSSALTAGTPQAGSFACLLLQVLCVVTGMAPRQCWMPAVDTQVLPLLPLPAQEDPLPYNVIYMKI